MKIDITKIVGAILCVGALLASQVAKAEMRENIADSLSNELVYAETASDSLQILSNLYDLRPKTERDSIGKMLLHTALVAKNDIVGLDMVRNLANLHIRNDSLLAEDLKWAMQFPKSDNRDETVAFVRMMQNVNMVRYTSSEQKEQRLRQLLREVSLGDKDDIFENIVLLHGICLYIGESAQGELLSKYLGRLGKLVDQLPEECYSIRNCYYVQAALAYAENDEAQKSIDTDKKLLEAINGLERGDIGLSRPYRSYDGNRYIIYTRLLSNYKKLDGAEVESLYKKVVHLIQTDSLSATTNRLSMRPQIYYAMYKKDYGKALDLLKSYIDYPYNATARRRLLKMMVKAAEETGDIDVLLTASRNYNDALEDALEHRTREKYKELQIVYDVSQMKADHAREAARLQRTFTWVAIGASVVLLILLVIVVLLWLHSRKLTRKLVHSNGALMSESNNLRQAQADLIKARDDAQLANRIKSDFIKNMSGEVAVPLHTINEYTNLIIDCSEAGVKPYLKHFAELVTLNSELLTSIVNDVLNLSEIDSDAVSVSMKKEPLMHICKMAVDSMSHRVHPGVTVELDETVPDVTVYTDPRRLMQILVQVLSNAAKFTKEGKISVSFVADEQAGMAHISVADTGIGVSPENAERIFERFVKLDRSSQGVGIGLPIARHLADLLAGTVTLDTSYGDGARFIVSIPLG